MLGPPPTQSEMKNEKTPRKILREFPSQIPSKQQQQQFFQLAQQFQNELSAPPLQGGSNSTPRKLLREYPTQATTDTTTLEVANGPPIPPMSSSDLSKDPTPRKLIKGLLNTTNSTPKRDNSEGVKAGNSAKKLIKGFLVAGKKAPSLSDSRDWSQEDAQFSTEAHRDLIKKTSFQDYAPTIIDGTFTLGSLPANSSKDLIKGFSKSHHGVVKDSRDWSPEDAEFNQEAHQELIKLSSFQNSFPQIIDGTFTIGLSPPSPTAPHTVLDLPISTDETTSLQIEDDVISGEEVEDCQSSIFHNSHLHNDNGNDRDRDNDNQLKSRLKNDLFNSSRQDSGSINQAMISDQSLLPPPPLPLPCHSPSFTRRPSPSPSVTTRKRKSLVVITETATATQRSPIISPGTPLGSHPATPIGLSHPQSPSISVSIPWTTSNDSLHLSSNEKNQVDLNDSQDDIVSSSSTSSSSSSSDSDSESESDSEDESELNQSGVSRIVNDEDDDDEDEEGKDTSIHEPLFPPPPPPPTSLPPPPLSASSSVPSHESTSHHSSELSTLPSPSPSLSLSTPPAVNYLTLPKSSPITFYQRSSAVVHHLAFLDLVDIFLHLLNLLLCLLILLSLGGCLLLVYVRHQLLNSDEESIMMFGMEISPAMIAL